MPFTNPIFFLFFLPAFLLVYRLVTPGFRFSLASRIVIIGGTYAFYGYENLGFLVPFVFATAMDLLWSQLLSRTQNPRWRRAIVTASVVQNLALFFVFKYLNWVAQSFPAWGFAQELQRTFADNNGRIPLPPGISFYLFESLSFVIDCYRRTIRTPRNPLDFLAFISMFPRFIAGPIVRYADLREHIQNFRGTRIADGLFVFAAGFSLKILLADSCGYLVDQLFGVVRGFWPSWIATLGYSAQLYLDFSAYSLMAVGLGMTLGFPFLDNFREPYHARSITEFWKRWHISLSTWLRDYLYIPLGGSRAGPARRELNLFLTMLIGGIWHGANSTFALWGAYHGLLLIADKRWFASRPWLQSRAVTFLLVALGWVMFRAANTREAGHVYRGLVGLDGSGWTAVMGRLEFVPVQLTLAALGGAWIAAVEPWLRRRRANASWAECRVENAPWWTLCFTAACFMVAVLFVFSLRSIPFLYFQF